jgi:adenine nucleotide transporter 17
MFSRESLAEAVSGGLADGLTATILFPLDVLKIRVQTDPSSSAQSIIKEEGLLALWKGVSDKWIVSPQQKFQYFYVETALFALFDRLFHRKPNTGEHLILGYLAALQGNITTIPLDVTLTRRLAARKKGLSDAQPQSFFQSFKEAVEKDGFAAFYKGWIVSALLCFNPAITYVFFERIKLYITRHRDVKQLNSLEAFVAGAISKAVATWLTFPFIRAKAILNTWTKLHKGEPIPTLNEILQRIVREEGFVGLFTGIYPQLTKGVLNSALMLMFKERIDAIGHYLVLGKKI